MKKGFTLIELLVVISIIAILSGIILAALTNSREKSNDAKVKEQVNSLRNAAEIYSSANKGKYQKGITTVSVCPFTDASPTHFLMDASSTNGNGWGIVNSIELDLNLVAPDATKIDCGISATGFVWSVAAILPSGAGSVCMDTAGTEKSYSATVASGASADPHTVSGQTTCN